jgi:hypothetical protein
MVKRNARFVQAISGDIGLVLPEMQAKLGDGSKTVISSMLGHQTAYFFLPGKIGAKSQE